MPEPSTLVGSTLSRRQHAAQVRKKASNAMIVEQAEWDAKEADRRSATAARVLTGFDAKLRKQLGDEIYSVASGPMIADGDTGTGRVDIDLGIDGLFIGYSDNGPQGIRLHVPCRFPGCEQLRYSAAIYGNGDRAWADLGRLIDGIDNETWVGFEPHTHSDALGDPLPSGHRIAVRPVRSTAGERFEDLVREIVGLVDY